MEESLKALRLMGVAFVLISAGLGAVGCSKDVDASNALASDKGTAPIVAPDMAVGTKGIVAPDMVVGTKKIVAPDMVTGTKGIVAPDMVVGTKKIGTVTGTKKLSPPKTLTTTK
jgi:hypothetical protein